MTYVALGDVSLNLDAKRVPVRASFRRPGPYPYYGASGIVDWVSDFLFEGRHLLVAEDGENLRSRSTPIAFLADGQFWVNNHAHVLTARPGVSDIRYLCYQLQLIDVTGYLTGSAQPKLNRSALDSIQIWLPDLATQTAIADVLGSLDDKIAANERVIQVSEDLLRTRFLRECDRAQQILRVSDILDFNPPRPKPLDDEPIYVEMKDLGTHTSVITSWSRRAPLGGVRFQRGDTVMGRITPCLENGKVGYVDFLREGEIGIGSTEFISMATRDGLPKPLSFLVAEHPGFRQEAVQLMVGTSGRQRVSARDLGEIELQLPDDGTLRELGRAAEAVFELLARLRDENRSLAATRDALLPELMSGRLTVGEFA